MPNFRDYEVAWISPEGSEYRKDFYERQCASGTDPLLANPTVEELVAVLEKHNPQSIIEIGCGFGRLLEPIAKHFMGTAIAGCDVSKDMLDLCSEDLVTAEVDICKPGTEEILNTRWDVAYCRGVFMYFDRHQIRTAMQTISLMVTKKIIIYEWDVVCHRMRDVLTQYIDGESKWEYYSLTQEDE